MFIFFLRLIVSQPFSDPYNLTLIFTGVCVCVEIIIHGFPCFSKYLFVKGIELGQIREKGAVPEMVTMFSGEGHKKNS